MQVITRSPNQSRYAMKRAPKRVNDFNVSIPVNLKECDDHFELQLAIPGFEREQIAIEFKEGDTLVIRGSVKKNEETGQFHQQEFVPRSFEKAFTVGDSIDKEKISASISQGVLIINLQKREEAKKEAPRTIEVF